MKHSAKKTAGINRSVIVLLFGLLMVLLILLIRFGGWMQSHEPADGTPRLPEETQFDDGIDVVCLDAGHGFGDVGCQSENLGSLDERDITLAMVMRLKAALEEKGMIVVLTHDGEHFPSVEELNRLAGQHALDYEAEKFIDNNIYSPYERCIYVNAMHRLQPIDLMISLHVNSNPHTEYCREFVIDYCAENSSTALSAKAARAITDRLLADFEGYEVSLLADIWEESYIVTKFTEVPSMLIEMGYATNIFDAVNLLSEDWRERFIASLAEGIAEYLAQ